MANDRFNKKIILLKKEKVRPSSNTKSEEFLQKKLALNILLP